MLEIKNLTKIYKPKKGVPVRALDGVSLKLPERGMVFLLGKSGSGKSTLLNLLGGLDKYDDGEIIIKGVSSKKFRQRHFDSYRNTYVGFIFQEYNVLDEFTVGANIGLALELQGKKATNEAINTILKEVDLEGFGNRRPNELSGGQKQRVAIARALVKNPKIIMADEPTGALDSVTGKQVFDTLKKLSKEKLVIVVSHDRDFATKYADRIIELADGKIISDTSLSGEAIAEENEGITFKGDICQIPMDYRLTEADRIAINEYLDHIKKGGVLEFSAAKGKSGFVPTDESKIQSTDTTPFKLIKSKLALRHAFKIGGSGLKHKKVRLVFTIILSCIAFVLFGLADTFGAYDHIKTCTTSIIDSNVTYATLSKAVLMKEGDYEYWDNWNQKFDETELAKIEADTGVDFRPVVTVSGGELSFSHSFGEYSSPNVVYDVYATAFEGVVEITENDIRDLGYKVLAGKLPEKGKNQVAISAYVAESFMKYELSVEGLGDGIFVDGNDKGQVEKIKKPSDLVGKTIFVGENTYTIAGVIDTNFDWDRYKGLAEISEEQDTADAILNYAIYREFSYASKCSHAGLMMVASGDMEAILATSSAIKEKMDFDLYFTNTDGDVYPYYLTTLENIEEDDITWIGKKRDTLGEKEIIITSDMANGLYETYDEWGNSLGFDKESLNKLGKTDYTMIYYNYRSSDGEEKTEGYKVVGVIDCFQSSLGRDSLAVIPDALMDSLFKENGDYTYLLGSMPQGESAVKSLVSYCYNEDGDVRYPLNNAVCFELDSLNEGLGMIAIVFLYIGLGFALFAAVLLSNFIATSISYKKQEIGILRAIGSRGNDVFRIFFAESFIIAMINFVLSCVGVFAVTTIINYVVRNNVGLLLTVFNFGIRQVALVFAVSVAAAFIASFLPVKKIASMRPIDAIRNK